LIDELVAMFGGRSQLVMMHLVRSGRLEDVKEAERELKRLQRKDKFHGWIHNQRAPPVIGRQEKCSLPIVHDLVAAGDLHLLVPDLLIYLRSNVPHF
jgi:hypothetical protein